MSSTYRLVPGSGIGSFLSPPGHPDHTHHVEEYAPNGRKPLGTISLQMILDPTAAYPDYITSAVRSLIDASNPVMSEMWVRYVYGYFAHSYVPESGSLRAQDLIIIQDASGISPNRHRAVVLIREYFPHHEPRLDLIADSRYGYGRRPCTSCGNPVQYEARLDALSHTVLKVRGSVYDPHCPSSPDGKHHHPTA